MKKKKSKNLKNKEELTMEQTKLENVEKTTEEVTETNNIVEETNEQITETEEITVESHAEVPEEPTAGYAEVIEEGTAVLTGHVNGCERLNVREIADKQSVVLTVINENDSVEIDVANSTEEFYKVKINDVEGYCVKEYVQID